MQCRIYSCPRRIAGDPTFSDRRRREEGSRRGVPAGYGAADSVAGYSFVRAIILGCVAFSPVHSRITCRTVRSRVHFASARLLLFRWLRLLRSYLLWLLLPLYCAFVSLLDRETRGKLRGTCKYRKSRARIVGIVASRGNRITFTSVIIIIIIIIVIAAFHAPGTFVFALADLSHPRRST